VTQALPTEGRLQAAPFWPNVHVILKPRAIRAEGISTAASRYQIVCIVAAFSSSLCLDYFDISTYSLHLPLTIC